MIPNHQDLSFQGVRVLFAHQNFPGQFVHLAPALQAAGAK